MKFSNLLKKYISDRFKKSLRFLDKDDRKKLVLISIIQSSLAILDLIGVATIGFLSSLAVSGIQSKSPGDRVREFLSVIRISQLTLQEQIAMLGLIATLTLVIRTALSIFFTKKINKYLSIRAAQIACDLFKRMLYSDYLRVSRIPSQEMIWGLSFGISAIMLGIFGSLTIVFSDIFMLLILFFGLLIVNSAVAILTVTIFLTISLLLYKLLNKRAMHLGSEQSALSIENNEIILEALSIFRNIRVGSLENSYSQQFEKLRVRLAMVLAKAAFLPNVSKYVIEIAVVIGALIISAAEFYLADASHAIATLAIFLAAGSRIAPAILRIQQSALNIKNILGGIETTLFLDEYLIDKTIIENSSQDEKDKQDSSKFIPSVKISNLYFKYPESTTDNLIDINLEIKEGTTYALVGVTGSGKSTLIDVILGILEPNYGTVLISGLPPKEFMNRFPGLIGYVPQSVPIIDGSIRNNVALGLPDSSIDDSKVIACLKKAKLEEFVNSINSDIYEVVGEGGYRLSGGQKQRLGIARALYSNPKFLIMDEATSALDSKTESEISESLMSLAGELTILVVAHRLTSIRSFKNICYLEKGKVLSVGDFNELRNSITQFDEQARLFGM